jgi:hypothetical protein
MRKYLSAVGFAVWTITLLLEPLFLEVGVRAVEVKPAGHVVWE